MDEPPIDEPPMGPDEGPAMDEPPMGPDEGPAMDEPNSDDQQDSGVNQELIDAISSLGMEDQNAVLKYAKSMADNSSNDDTTTNDMPMEGRRISKRRINELFKDMLGDDDARIRDTKEITNKKIKKGNPFISGRL